MPTCKNCVHVEVCRYICTEDVICCKFFKDRAKFIELRHGFWKKRFIKLQPELRGGFVYEPEQEIAQCSICCREIAVGNDSVMFPFCPCCGGKMDEYEQALKERDSE